FPFCDPPHPEIYTLSLHDALPIFVAAALSADQAAAPAVDAAFSAFFQARTVREAAVASDQIVASGVGFDEAFRRLRQGRIYSREDRKSTRLNSSHVSISYAVFCLK